MIENLQHGIYRWTSENACHYTEKAIYFDMDGTIADLYGVDNWCERLDSYDASVYYEAPAMVDEDALWEFCSIASNAGYRIGIISWMSKGEFDDQFAAEIIDAKMSWCSEELPVFDEIVIAPYGFPKSECVEIANNAILIDDDKRVRREWDSAENNRVAYSADDMESVFDDIASECCGDYEYSPRLSFPSWG